MEYVLGLKKEEIGRFESLILWLVYEEFCRFVKGLRFYFDGNRKELLKDFREWMMVWYMGFFKIILVGK